MWSDKIRRRLLKLYLCILVYTCVYLVYTYSWCSYTCVYQCILLMYTGVSIYCNYIAVLTIPLHGTYHICIVCMVAWFKTMFPGLLSSIATSVQESSPGNMVLNHATVAPTYTPTHPHPYIHPHTHPRTHAHAHTHKFWKHPLDTCWTFRLHSMQSN